jgi:hypothetical protein
MPDESKDFKRIIFDYLVEKLEMIEVREEWALNYLDQLQSQRKQSPTSNESKSNSRPPTAEKSTQDPG